MSQYAYIYNQSTQAVAVGDDVTFDSNGAMTPGITHATGTAGITLLNTGTYLVSFSVSGTEPNQMALFLNGALVDGSIYGSGAGTQQNTGQVIVVVPAGGEVLTLENHTSSAPVTLATVVGGTAPNVNASVSIEKLA
jgi:hypothetical protein